MATVTATERMTATEFRQAIRGVSAGTWGILGLAAASAVALAVVSASPYARFLRHDYGASSRSGQVVALSLFLLGWTLMIAAMMLPTAVSLLAAVGRLVEDASVGRDCRHAPLVGSLPCGWPSASCSAPGIFSCTPVSIRSIGLAVAPN